MPTDASILLGLKPMQTTNPMEMYEAGQRIETNRLAGIMNGMKMDEYKTGVERSNTLRNLLSGTGNDSTDATVGKLRQGGYLKESMDFAKSAGDLAKDAAATGKTRIESAGLAMTQHRDAVNMIQSPGDVKQWLTAGYNNPDLKPIFERYGTLQESLGKIDAQVTNPEQLDKWKLTASTNAETLLKQLNPDANAKLQAKTSTDNSIRTAASSKYSTDSAANNSALGRAQSASQFLVTSGQKNAELAAGGKAPAGYRWKPDGTLEGIPGGPVGSKADQSTEGERKAATLLKRLEGSQIQLNAALDEKPNAAKPGVIASAIRSVGAESAANSFAVGSERQRVEAAQLDMLDAALTLGTGAAYTKEQLLGYQKSYFPQIGDTTDNVRDKKARLANVIDAAKIAAGRSAPKAEMPGYQDSIKPTQPAAMPPGFKVIR